MKLLLTLGVSTDPVKKSTAELLLLTVTEKSQGGREVSTVQTHQWSQSGAPTGAFAPGWFSLPFLISNRYKCQEHR